MLRFLGFVLFAASAICGCAAWYVDRQLQAYRLSGVPDSSYFLVPTRIRHDLYRPEAGHLVDRAWRLIAAMYGLALIGMVLVAFGA